MAHKARNGLNERHEFFVREYVRDFNATQAYIRAGFSARGHAAEVNAGRLLRKAEVKAAIARRWGAGLQAADLSIERVMREIARIALLDIRRLYDENGDIRPLHTLGDDEAAAISSIESTTSRSLEAASSENPDDVKTIERVLKKLKVHDKLSALTLAMRHHGMLNDSVKISGSVETAVRYVANMPERSDD